MKLNHKLLLSTIAILAASASQSFASGYSTNSTSASAAGNSYAGSVTGVHDVSDMFFNPSVTAGIDKNQFIATMTYLKLDIQSHGSAGRFSGLYGGGSVSGGDSRGAGSNNFIPAFYLAMPINDKTTFNFSVTSPFGLATKYDADSVMRYTAVESSITTLNFNPSIAYKVSNKLSIGGGLVAQYYTTTLTKMTFTGVDSNTKLSASDWGYGYNLGATYHLNDDLKVAIGYRSKIDHNLSGSGSVVGNVQLYSDIAAKTSTPESLTIGAAYKFNPKVELVYDTTWMRWSRFKSLQVRGIQNSAFTQTVAFNWHDSFLHSVGANFSVSEKTIIRTGLAYEKDAITNANREPMLPMGDRVWVSAGFSRKLVNDWSFDGSYAHQFYRSARMNVSDSAAQVSSLSAKYKTKVDVFSIALKKDF